MNGWSEGGGSHGPGDEGGLLVTDAIDADLTVLDRPHVTVLNPDGVTAGVPSGVTYQARGMKVGDRLDLKNAYPSYEGIVVKVEGSVPGPPGKPEALKVSVKRSPGDFIDLEIRPWEAPDTYATHDIWIDRPGNGHEEYDEPPLGTGDVPVWDPDGAVLNKVMVRVHNRGTVEAKGVVVRAWHNEPMGAGDAGDWVPFDDSRPKDIAAGGHADFGFDWFPVEDQENGPHTCIKAQIVGDASPLGDLDYGNNEAQENINGFATLAGSPYKPMPFRFQLANGYDHPLGVDLVPAGLPDGMELELERGYVKLAPREVRTMRGRLFVDRDKIAPAPQGKRACHYKVNISAFKHTRDSRLPFGGFSMLINPTFPSRLAYGRASRKGDDPTGTTLSVSGKLFGPFNRDQTIEAVLVAGGVTYGGKTQTAAGGNFSLPITGVPVGQSGSARLTLYYFGPDLGPSRFGPTVIDLL